MHGKPLEHRKIEFIVECPPVSASSMRLVVDIPDSLICGNDLSVSVYLEGPWKIMDFRMAPLVTLVTPSGSVQHIQISMSKEDPKRQVVVLHLHLFLVCVKTDLLSLHVP